MSVPRDQAKQLICEIIAASGGRLVGKVRLHKAFYYAHLYYWQRGAGVLTSYPVVRLPFGPAIDDGPHLVAELVREGRLRVGQQPIGPYKETVFELAEPFRIDPNNPRYQAVEEAVDQVKSKTAVELSEETHLFSRSWQEGQNGQELDIYTDLLDDFEYQQIQEGGQEIRELVGAVFESQG
jgi:hypothetical protein